MYALRALSTEALLSRLEDLIRQERESLADVVEHLVEVDRREAALDGAYASLFEYCVKKLGYSEGAAFLRIRAARAAAEFPEVIERLRSGRLHIDSIARLSPHLTAQNSRALLARADGASKRDVLALVATLGTATGPARDMIAPAPPVVTASPAARDPGDLPAEFDANAAPEIVPRPLHRFHFTGDDELLSLVERLRGLLRHKYPGGRLESIFKESARSLLERMEKDRRPAGKAPRRKQAGLVAQAARHGSRQVPRSVKREVWVRDEGRCAYTSSEGRRCESRDALEYDHIVPWADGGRSDTPQNIRLLCRAHNQRLGRKRFGPRPRQVD